MTETGFHDLKQPIETLTELDVITEIHVGSVCILDIALT